MGRDCSDRDNPLGRFGFGGRCELGGADFLGGDTPRRQGGNERFASRRLSQLWRYEGSPHWHRRADQLFDGADSLGDEQLVFLAGLPTLQVARQGQEFQLSVR